MPAYTQNQLEQALKRFEAGDFASQKECCLEYGIPPSTFSTALRDRSEGSSYASSRSEAHENQQRLPRISELWLKDWILELNQQHRAPSLKTVRKMANLLLDSHTPGARIGKNWIPKFLRRHPEIRRATGRRIARSRVDAASPDAIREFFSLYSMVIKQYDIPPARIWNFDEHGQKGGQASDEQVLAQTNTVDKGRVQIKNSDDTEWATAIKCISATGHYLPPVIIFKGQHLQTSWFRFTGLEKWDWRWASSANGWTSNDIGLHWLREVFLPLSKPAKSSQWRLLICDNHGSHVTEEFMYEARKNRVYLLYLPPHTSHILQPLDVSVFGPLKRAYHSKISEIISLDDNSTVKKRHFNTIYYTARMETVNERNIRSGWRETGLVPINPNFVLDLPEMRKTIPRPHTPEQNLSRESVETLAKTPHGAQDVVIRYDVSEREARIQEKAIKKALNIKNLQLAEQKAEIERLRRQLEELNAPKQRTRIQLNSNTKFAVMDQIIEQQQAQEVRGQKAKAKKKKVAQKSIAIEKEYQGIQFVCKLFR
jgi:hypothetical protein